MGKEGEWERCVVYVTARWVVDGDREGVYSGMALYDMESSCDMNSNEHEHGLDCWVRF